MEASCSGYLRFRCGQRREFAANLVFVLARLLQDGAVRRCGFFLSPFMHIARARRISME